MAACNATESIAKAQLGGTTVMAFGTFSQHIGPSGGSTDCKEPTGLGQWCSLVSKCGAKKTRFVVAYRPCVPSALRRRGAQRSGNEHRRMKVWEQQSRYF